MGHVIGDAAGVIALIVTMLWYFAGLAREKRAAAAKVAVSSNLEA